MIPLYEIAQKFWALKYYFCVNRSSIDNFLGQELCWETLNWTLQRLWRNKVTEYFKIHECFRKQKGCLIIQFKELLLVTYCQSGEFIGLNEILSNSFGCTGIRCFGKTFYNSAFLVLKIINDK